MAGIYIHIPFCKTRCIYCDFYSTTRSELKQQYIRALCTELKTRKGYLKEEPIETIYFGGGTPSQLAHEDFEQIFRTIKEVYGTEHAEEITLEANPDDHQARFDLAQALHAAGEAEAAVQELLELFRRDREWNDGAAKAQLFTIFEALKPNDPVVLNGRRKLSSMIFA